MTVIATTPYSNITAETILIGANCISESNRHKIAADKIPIINPYNNIDDVINASEYCWKASLDICDTLADFLNRVHSVDYTRRYWRILLLPWIVTFVENLYDRYLRLCWIRKNISNAVIEIPHVKQSSPLYRSSIDVMKSARLPSLNSRLYKFLIGSMRLNHRIRYPNVGNIDETIVRDTVESKRKDIDLKEAGKEIIKNLLKQTSFLRGSYIFYGYPVEKNIDFLKLSLGLGSFQWGNPRIEENIASKQDLSRTNICFEVASDEFKDILLDIMKLAIPVSFFEKYHGRRQIVLNYLNKKKIKTIFIIKAAYYAEETLKFLMAEIKERGGKVVSVQHGGGYGYYLKLNTERLERDISDYFVTWGWEDEKMCPAVALPYYNLSELIDCHIGGDKKKIVFIGSQGPMYMFRYQSYWMPEFVQNKYFILKQVFFQGLKDEVKREILYKAFPVDYGWNEKKRIREMLPNVCFDDHSLAVHTMKDASLVVIDHPSTSFLEAMVMNVPTILFWDKAQCPMRQEAEPYFRKLLDAGMLFHDPEVAAKKVNQIYEDPLQWWSARNIQDARLEFCKRFAYARKDWIRIWIQGFKNLSRR